MQKKYQYIIEVGECGSWIETATARDIRERMDEGRLSVFPTQIMGLICIGKERQPGERRNDGAVEILRADEEREITGRAWLCAEGEEAPTGMDMRTAERILDLIEWRTDYN